VVTSETPLSDFAAAYATAKDRCCAPADRCASIWREARRARKLPGDFAELGVWRGGTACLMSLAAPDKDLYLFDTFAGMPEPSSVDVHQRGDFGDTSAQEVLSWLAARTGSLHRHHLKVGRFPETTADVDSLCFACVHLDGDLYESTKAGLEYFWPRLPLGGSIICDDFGWTKCPGVAQAIADYFGLAIASLAERIQDAGEARAFFIGTNASGPKNGELAMLNVSALDQCVIRKAIYC